MGKNYPKFIMIQLILYIPVKRKKRATINNIHNTFKQKCLEIQAYPTPPN